MSVSAPVTRLNEALEGRYRIERKLGEGAMATVYLAHDERQNRHVALKVLKPELAAVVGAKRFLAEIETTAKLQHPHILPLFDSGEADGFLFYVMPYVRGETLEERIDREKQLPVDEALGIATAVAHALQTAHEAGVVHRDIKPGNILLSRGEPLVADFGIALAVGGAGGARLTETGVSIGTPRYMSPEQATGDEVVGPSSDIFALACVLYEMLVGEPPFTGTTAQAILGKLILEAPVSAAAVRKSVPPNVDAAIRKALEKLPADRFREAGDFARALADPSFRHGEAVGVSAATAWMAAWIAAAVVVGAIAGMILAPGPDAPTRPETLRFVITHEDGDHDQLVVTAGTGHDMRLAPDGSELVYLGLRGGTRRLYRRPLGSFRATALTRTDGAYQPFFSPDGRSLGFFARGTLKRMQFPAGAPLDVIDLGANPSGATWLSDDTIVVGMRQTGLVRIAASDGARETLTVPDPQRGETAHNWPEALPGGAGVLFTALHGPDLANARIAVWSADAADWSIVLDGEGYNARYTKSGHLIYGRAGVLWAVPFDAERLLVTGKPVQVLDDRVVTKGQGAQAFAVSSNGTLAFVPSPPTDAELVWMDREGTFIEPVRAPVRPYVGPKLSPDGKRIVVDVDGKAWMYDIENGNLAALPGTDRSSPPQHLQPSWSPDGSRIAFIAGGERLYTAPADGSGSADLVWESPVVIGGPKWSPDGEIIVVNTVVAESGTDLWQVSLDDGQPAPYLQGADNTEWPAFSPSGSWVAYSSSESGQAEIYARPFPTSAGRRVEISAGGGTKPLWFDGELFYRRGERVVSVRIEETATNLRILGREQLPVVLPDEGDDRRWLYDYDYDPVNGRFLVVRPVIVNPGPRIYVVVNWLAEISARMGARK